LRPSLVTAIIFLTEQLRIDREPEQKAILKILHLILLTKTAPGEPTALLTSVLSIVAVDLESALRAHQRARLHNSSDAQQVLQALRDSNIMPSRRTGGADAKELEPWATTPGGGLAAMMRLTMQGFVKWSLNPGVNVMPTSYTHRQFLAARHLLGARHVLSLLLGEISSRVNTHAVAFAYDIVASIICSADVLNGRVRGGAPGPRMSLRDALWYEMLSSGGLLLTEPVMAEIMVRLHRRVEALLAPVPEPANAMLGADVAALALGMDVVGVPDGLTDAMDSAPALDLDIGSSVGGGMSLGTGTISISTDADVFSGMGPLVNWDGISLN